jgi:hypothetical protein
MMDSRIKVFPLPVGPKRTLKAPSFRERVRFFMLKFPRVRFRSWISII